MMTVAVSVRRESMSAFRVKYTRRELERDQQAYNMHTHTYIREARSRRCSPRPILDASALLLRLIKRIDFNCRAIARLIEFDQRDNARSLSLSLLPMTVKFIFCFRVGEFLKSTRHR